MSSQRKNTLKNLIKKGMFASTAAVMLASTSTLGIANPSVIANNAVLSTGAGLSAPFTSGDLLTLDGPFNFTADRDVLAIYLDNFGGVVMTVPNNLILGPVIPVDLTKANVGLVVNVPNVSQITLTGTPVTPAEAAAAFPPFAPGPGDAPGHTYYFNSFNFNNHS